MRPAPHHAVIRVGSEAIIGLAKEEAEGMPKTIPSARRTPNANPREADADRSGGWHSTAAVVTQSMVKDRYSMETAPHCPQRD